MQMLNEPMTESGSTLGAESHGPSPGDAPVAGGQNPESGFIQVTPEEKQAVERVRENLKQINGLHHYLFFIDVKNNFS